MMRRFSRPLACLLLAATAACAPPAYNKNWPYSVAPNYPAGLWRSSSGWTIEIGQDGAYSVCGGNTCDRGKIERFGKFGVTLKDFANPDHTVARALLNWSGYEKEWLHGGADLDFTPNLGPPANAEECRGRPCMQMGPLDAPQYTFILQR
jgi:hypothetical protein